VSEAGEGDFSVKTFPNTLFVAHHIIVPEADDMPMRSLTSGSN
jgi:hypothetical protein